MFGNTVKQNEGPQKWPLCLLLRYNLCSYFDVVYWFASKGWIPEHSSDNPVVKAFTK